ncbi:MAG: hypothetical protein AAF990_12280 [Bacteroidota bacterium]
MRYTLRCPKCDSKNVVEVIGANINQQQKIPLTKWSMRSATLDRYICADCGYTEEYVQLTDTFKKWARKRLNEQERRYDDYV